MCEVSFLFLWATTVTKLLGKRPCEHLFQTRFIAGCSKYILHVAPSTQELPVLRNYYIYSLGDLSAWIICDENVLVKDRIWSTGHCAV
ncbi:hypothetical protein M758_12G055800 [Ceratodon purpureus]|nr:hypothetical protein M758_12G055800 [Ceratodon purpureus]